MNFLTLCVKFIGLLFGLLSHREWSIFSDDFELYYTYYLVSPAHENIEIFKLMESMIIVRPSMFIKLIWLTVWSCMFMEETHCMHNLMENTSFIRASSSNTHILLATLAPNGWPASVKKSCESTLFRIVNNFLFQNDFSWTIFLFQARI